MSDSRDTASELLRDGSREGPVVVLAHGAGAPMDSEWMNEITAAIAAHGIGVVRFEFPYMARRRHEGTRPGPDRAPVLEARWREVIEEVGRPERQVIGGKSMGGRIATRVADEAGVAGVVALGYPFHPPGRPEKVRTAHLEELRTPTLVLQGTRDPFGKPEEIAGYELSPAIEVVWIEDGDHGWTPRKRSGRTLEENVAEAVRHLVAHVERVT